MNIIKRIKEWISPTQQYHDEIYIDFRKLRQRELEQEFNSLNSGLDFRFTSNTIPYLWNFHIEKCVQYNEIEIALSHLNWWNRCCEMAAMEFGYKLDLTPIWKTIKNSKQYKQIMIEKKIERMKADFE